MAQAHWRPATARGGCGCKGAAGLPRASGSAWGEVEVRWGQNAFLFDARKIVLLFGCLKCKRRLWLLEREKQADDVLGRAQDYARQSLAWLADREGVEIEVAASWPTRTAMLMDVQAAAGVACRRRQSAERRRRQRWLRGQPRPRAGRGLALPHPPPRAPARAIRIGIRLSGMGRRGRGRHLHGAAEMGRARHGGGRRADGRAARADRGRAGPHRRLHPGQAPGHRDRRHAARIAGADRPQPGAQPRHRQHPHGRATWRSRSS